MRLTLVISSLRAGGAERVMSTLANAWACRGESVSLITLAPASEDFYRLDSRVNRIALGVTGTSNGLIDRLRHTLHRIRKLRSAIRQCRGDVVLSFSNKTNVLAILATRGLSVPIVVSERVDPRHHDIGRVASLLRRLTYRKASHIVVQTNVVRDWAKRVGGSCPVSVIPNPVTLPTDSSRAQTDPIIVAMGRLHRQKGFDLLIEAFARVRNRHPEWSLEILGEGPERASLEELIQSLGLQDRARLVGLTPHPHRYLRKAGLFVLSSRYEGFPNVLLEAMASRLPVIAADCPSGPAEIVRHGYDGLLVPSESVGAMGDAIDGLLANPTERERLAENAQGIRRVFDPSKIIDAWQDVLTGLTVGR